MGNENGSNLPPPAAPTPEQLAAQGLAKLAGPFLIRYAPWLVAGLGIFGGIEQGTNASANYQELRKDVAEIRKELGERRIAEVAAVARAQAERHEERIRALEEHAQGCKSGKDGGK